MSNILGKVLLVIIPLIMLIFFLLVDPKGILKAFLSVFRFLMFPIISGIIFGGWYFFAVFVNQIFLFPLLYCLKQIINYLYIRKNGIRTDGTIVGFVHNRGNPKIRFALSDGNSRTEIAGSLKNHSVGDNIAVLYDKQNPEICFIEKHSLTGYIILTIIWLVGSAICLDITFWVMNGSSFLIKF